MTDFTHKKFQTMRKVRQMNKKAMTEFRHEKFQTTMTYRLRNKKALNELRRNIKFLIVEFACLRKRKKSPYLTRETTKCQFSLVLSII